MGKYTYNKHRKKYGHHAAGFTTNRNSIDTRQIRQAGVAIRPSGATSIQGDISPGIQSTFSNVYRRRNESIQDIIDRCGRAVVPSGNRRFTSLEFATAHGRSPQRDGSERAQRASDDQSLALEYMLNSIRNGDVSIVDSEETATRH